VTAAAETTGAVKDFKRQPLAVGSMVDVIWHSGRKINAYAVPAPISSLSLDALEVDAVVPYCFSTATWHKNIKVSTKQANLPWLLMCGSSQACQNTTGHRFKPGVTHRQ
jgi:hypothetical protein